MNELSQRISIIKSSKPVGELHLVGNNGYAKDKLGRIYKVKSIESIEAFKRKMSIEQDKRDFSFTNMHNIKEITNHLTNKYCGYLILLQPNIEYKTGRLAEQKESSRSLTIKDISDIWGTSRRTAQRVMDEFELRSIVFNSDGVFTINSRYHFRDKSKGVDALIKIFFSPLRTFKLSIADFGFVFKLLAYVHYETNMICEDPFADPENIKFLNDKEIGELVGLAEVKAREVLTRLRRAKIIGEFTNLEDKREKFTVLNPYVFYRKSGQPDSTLRAMFAKYKV